MPSEFRPHQIAWTHERSARLWDFHSSTPAYADTYFSKVVGDLVITQVRRRTKLEGRILDFGCGPGYLMEKLIARGIPVEGIDFSEASVAAVRQRFSGNPLFRGAQWIQSLPIPVRDGAYDVVFLIETIEHLLPEVLDSTLAELSRVLRRGGRIVVTTPNREDLDANTVMCPECGCTFHRIQHVHSWSVESLSRTMGQFGFRTVRLDETTFRRGYALTHLFRIGFMLLGRRQPNLFYIGEKT